MRRHLFCVAVFAISAAAAFAGWNLLRQGAADGAVAVSEEGAYRFGEVSVCAERREIRFRGEVARDEGRVQHLVYLDGYKWLAAESAILSGAKLSDLQKAIALLDWKLWDRLWQGERRSGADEGASTAVMTVSWGGRELPAERMLSDRDEMEIGDLVFLGSPYFDGVALGGGTYSDCRLCPMFPLEERALRKMFVRESGRSGYDLDSRTMPARGTQVEIVVGVRR